MVRYIKKEYGVNALMITEELLSAWLSDPSAIPDWLKRGVELGRVSLPSKHGEHVRLTPNGNTEWICGPGTWIVLRGRDAFVSMSNAAFNESYISSSDLYGTREE